MVGIDKEIGLLMASMKRRQCRNGGGIIEFAYRTIEERGPLTVRELMGLAADTSNIRKMAKSPNQLSQKMRASPLFTSQDLVQSPGSRGLVKLWSIVPIETVARDFIALKASKVQHTLRKRRHLPRFLRDEIRRIENENRETN